MTRISRGLLILAAALALAPPCFGVAAAGAQTIGPQTPATQPIAKATAPLSPPAGPAAPTTAAAAGAGAPSDYKLGAGDKLRLTVYGEPGLTGEYYVSNGGAVSVPLIGEVRASGLTLSQLAEAVRAKLSDGYIRDPKVAAEVLTYRPYYILGEINKPGEYPYTSDLTVLNAVATAGGFTYRVQKKVVLIRHPQSSKEVSMELTAATPVEPGDTIRIKERFF